MSRPIRTCSRCGVVIGVYEPCLPVGSAPRASACSVRSVPEDVAVAHAACEQEHARSALNERRSQR